MVVFDLDSHNCSMYPAMMIGWNWAISIPRPWRQAQNYRTASAYARRVFLFRISTVKNSMNRWRACSLAALIPDRGC
jgi:hypothetical protein